MSLSLGQKLAARIREIRMQKGITQEEAARLCKIKYKYYQEHESKNPRDIRLSTMEKIAKGLGVSIKDLLSF